LIPFKRPFATISLVTVHVYKILTTVNTKISSA
jgi:hypothetical protein